jgi:hypothetical protein
MAEITPDRVFALNPKIRWAGLATDQGEVLFSTMRPGIKSVSPEETDSAFMQLGPMLLSGVSERFVPFAGPLEAVVSRYQKVMIIAKKLEGRYLALSIDSEDANELPNILQSLRNLTTL